MRPRTWLFLGPLALALAADVAPGACEAAWPAPADFKVELNLLETGLGTVLITWTPDQDLHEGVYFSAYIVQRRDDTAGGDFEPIHTTTFRYSGLTSQSVADPSHDPSCVSAQGCVEPGHTYTFRCIARFGYSVGCPLNDGNLHDAISNEAVLVVPGGAAGGAPRDVLAIGDPKKPRVTVTWTAPDKAPAMYEIRRRDASQSAAKDGKAEPAFTTVGRVKGTATKFTDKKISQDAVLEYLVVALANDGTESPSAYDIAYALAPRCRKSKFAIWDGRFAFEGTDGHYALDISGSLQTTFTSTYEDPAHDYERGIFLGGPGVKGDGGSSTADVDLKVERLGDDPEDWSKGLAVGRKGEVFVEFVEPGPLGPLDETAFNKVKGRVVFKDGKKEAQHLDFEAVRVKRYTKPDDDPHELSTSLCATVGVGTTEAIPIGGDVIVAYDLVNLGPSPLFSRRAWLQVDVVNGEIREILGRYYEVTDDPIGSRTATLKVGAIGPESTTRSEVASLILRLRTRAPADGKAQMSVSLKLLDDPSAPFHDYERLQIEHPVRTVEIPIVVPAKR